MSASQRIELLERLIALRDDVTLHGPDEQRWQAIEGEASDLIVEGVRLGLPVRQMAAALLVSERRLLALIETRRS